MKVPWIVFPGHRCGEIIFLTSQALTPISPAALPFLFSLGPGPTSILKPSFRKAPSHLSALEPLCLTESPKEPDKLSHFVEYKREQKSGLLRTGWGGSAAEVLEPHWGPVVCLAFHRLPDPVWLAWVGCPGKGEQFWGASFPEWPQRVKEAKDFAVLSPHVSSPGGWQRCERATCV